MDNFPKLFYMHFFLTKKILFGFLLGRARQKRRSIFERWLMMEGEAMEDRI